MPSFSGRCADHRLPGAGLLGHRTHEENLDSPAGFLTRKHPRRHYAGVIEDEQVTLFQMTREFVKPRMLDASAFAIKDQQTGLIAARERFLRDQFGRQVIIEFVEPHLYKCWLIWLRLVIDCKACPSSRPERFAKDLNWHDGFVLRILAHPPSSNRQLQH